MRVTDPDGVGTNVDMARFSNAIVEFEAWTGWRTVCVPELQVRPELNGGAVVGLYQGPHEAIQLVSGIGADVAIHEMCHAADQRLGWPSMDNPALFPVTHVDPVNYTSRDSQVRESFARACEAGPEGLSLVRAMGERCGFPIEHPGYTLVLNEVYGKAKVSRTPARLDVLDQHDVGIDGLVGSSTLLDVASGQSLVWLALKEPTPLRENNDATDILEREAWRVVGFDPMTGREVTTHTLLRSPPHPSEYARQFRLLDSVGDPLLVEGTNEAPTYLWRLHEDTGELELLHTLPFALGADLSVLSPAGVVSEGVALVRVDVPPDGLPVFPVPEHEVSAVRLLGQGWVAVDIESGAILDEHPVYKGVFDDQLDGGGTLLTASEEGVVAVGVEPAVFPFWPYRTRLLTPGGRIEEPRIASAGLSNPMGLTAQGDVMALWSNREVWSRIDTRRFWVVQTGDSFAVPDDACQPQDEGFIAIRTFHLGENTVLFGIPDVRSSRYVARVLSIEE